MALTDGDRVAHTDGPSEPPQGWTWSRVITTCRHVINNVNKLKPTNIHNVFRTPKSREGLSAIGWLADEPSWQPIIDSPPRDFHI